MHVRPAPCVALLLALAGCEAQDVLLYGAPPWSEDVVVVTGFLAADGGLLRAPEVFAPGAPVRVTPPPEAVRLLVATYADPQRDILRCGVRVAGELEPLPAAEATYEAMLEGEAIELRPRGPLGLDLRFADCVPRVDPCVRVQVERVDHDLPPDRPIRGFTAHDGALYASPYDGRIDAQLYRLERGRFVAVPLPEPVGGPQEGFRTMVSHQEHLWVSQGPRVYELDDDLRVRSSTQAPYFVERLVSDPEGPLLALSDSTSNGGAFDLTGALPRLQRSGGAVLEGPDLRLVLQPFGVVRWTGTRWADDYVFAFNETFGRLFGDAQMQVGTNPLGNLLIGRDGAWARYPPHPDYVFRLRAAVHAGEGRALVTGDDGFIGLWDGERWCNPELRQVSNSLLSIVPFEGAFYIAGNHISGVDDDVPPILRVQISPPGD